MEYIFVGDPIQKAQLLDSHHLLAGYATIDPQALQDVMLRVDLAFEAFFGSVRTEEALGYPRLRHETTFASVLSGMPGPNPLFCQWFPTAACANDNAGVRSFRDNAILTLMVSEA